MAETKKFRISWQVIYNASSNSKVRSSSPISVGESSNYQTFIGIPTAVRDALKTSKTTPKLYYRHYVYDATPEWDLGKHKLTSAPTTSTMPWYTYERAFQTGYTGTGWLQYDLSGSTFADEYKAGTYQGIVWYSGGSSTYAGDAYNTSTYPAEFWVEGDWNDAPTPPASITYPKGGETVDTSLKITWTAGSDPDGSPLKYMVAMNDGTGWKYSAWTANGATSYTWNTTALKETSTAQVAVKSSDGTLESGWKYSNKFTISHNSAPTAPTMLSPASGAIKDRTEIIRLSWKHNDDGAQASFRIAYRLKPSSIWTYYPSSTTFKASTNQYYDFAANTFGAGDIEWEVQTVDQQGLISPYSTVALFKASNVTTAPTILSPTANQVWTTDTLEVKWSSVYQAEWSVALYDSLGATVWSGSGTGSTKLVYPSAVLENGKTYGAWVKTKDTGGIWSEWANHTFTTNFTPPSAPHLWKTEEAGEGVLNVFYKAADFDQIPDIGDPADLTTPQNGWKVYATALTRTINSARSITLTSNNTAGGYEIYLDTDTIPINVGEKIRLEADVLGQGNRLFMTACDADKVAISQIASGALYSASMASGRQGVELTIPSGTAFIRVLLYTTADGVVNTTISNWTLKYLNSVSPTESMDVLRREYTPTGTAPWAVIAEGLSIEGSFLDYSPAHQITYEYKVRARSNSMGTSSESRVLTGSVEINSTFLQEASNLAGLIPLQYVNSRDVSYKVDSQITTFAGRKFGVREYGENEENILSVEFEVDTYAEVQFFKDMLARRDVWLYRDGNGRRFWVTTDSMDVADREIDGYVISFDLYETSYTEDLT